MQFNVKGVNIRSEESAEASGAPAAAEHAKEVTRHASTDKTSELRVYAETRKTEMFVYIDELYMGVQRGLNPSLTKLVLMGQPRLDQSLSDRNDGTIAVWERRGPTGGVITLDKKALDLFSRMQQYEADGNTDAAGRIRHYLDTVIGHETAHAMLGNFSAYMRPRLEEGLAELIGFYVAQRMEGKPFNNEEIADVMLKSVRMDIEEAAAFNAGLRTKWPTLNEDKKKEMLGKADVHAKRSTDYDYAMLGIAEALSANPGMQLSEFIQNAMIAPWRLQGLSEHAVNVTGPVAELASVLRRRSEFNGMLKMVGSSAILSYVGRVDDADAMAELELQDRLNAEMLGKIVDLGHAA